jgi:hypothetical protein
MVFLRISSGVIVWSVHFMAIYGFTALACAREFAHAVFPAVAVATLVAVALLIPIMVTGFRRRAEFEYWMAASLAALALIAVVWEALPVVLVPACA